MAGPVKKTHAVAASVRHGHGVGTHGGARPIGGADRRRSERGKTSGLDRLQEVRAGHQEQVVCGLVEIRNVEV